jgi:RNA polymerase sigma-70 factor (ECF subfamily)
MGLALSYALSLTRNRHEAEDVVQDCYLALLRRSGVYDLPRDGTRILMKSITHACINRWRRRQVASLDQPGGTDQEHGMIDSLPAPAASDPGQSAAAEELRQTVADGLASLPVNQRAALELKSMGHSISDIAQALGVTANHAGVLIHRARRTLAQRLKDVMKGPCT